MSYAILISKSHLQAPQVAAQLRQMLAAATPITGIFLTMDGVYVGLNNIVLPPPADFGFAVWQELATAQVPMVVCHGASLRRGIGQDHLAPGFRLGSVAHFVEFCTQADEIISF